MACIARPTTLVCALALAGILVVAAPAEAHRGHYHDRIDARQHAYDVARGDHRYKTAGRALRAKRYWQARERRHERLTVRHPHPARPSGGRYVLPMRVVMCESGGKWRAVNRTPAGRANGYPGGAYQITRPTWRAYGGAAFAPAAEQASPSQQGVIALRVLHAQGPGAWACW